MNTPARSQPPLLWSVLWAFCLTLGVSLFVFALYCVATLAMMLAETAFPGIGLHAGRRALENRDGVIGFLRLTFNRSWIVLAMVFLACCVGFANEIARRRSKPMKAMPDNPRDERSSESG